MDIASIEALYLESDRSDWKRLDRFAASVGATPYWEEGADGFNAAWKVHHYYAVHRTHPDVQIVWGMDEDETPFRARPKDARTFPELPHWADQQVYMETAVLLWRGMPVEFFFYLRVDGGRGVIPVPNVASDGVSMDANFAHYFLRHEINQVRVISELENYPDSRDYLAEAAREIQIVSHRGEVVIGADE